MTHGTGSVEAATPDEAPQWSAGARGRTAGIDLIVAGYDGSGEAATAVRWAAEMAQRCAASLRIVWAWRMRDVWDDALAGHDTVEIPSVDELEDIARRELTGVVESLIEGLAPDVEIHLERGPDSAGILLRAATGADLLVVGSRGHGRVAAAVVGSVSARCIQEATCPVVVIPHRMVVAPADHADPRTVQAEVLAPRAGSHR